MASKLFIFCIFAIVLLGYVMAEDYAEGEEGDGGDGGGEGGESSDDGGESQGEGGGDYEGDSGDSAGDGGEESDDSAAAAASHPSWAQILQPMLRKKRSLNTDNSKRVLSRVRRGGYGRVGPVYTYQKTDYHGNFKWGVRHNVGKQYGHGK